MGDFPTHRELKSVLAVGIVALPVNAINSIVPCVYIGSSLNPREMEINNSAYSETGGKHA